jgi:hypothetical protein
MDARPREPPPVVDRLVTGILLAHGPAREEGQGSGGQTYFVRIETERGVREFRDAGLAQAIRASRTKPQVGDEIGLRQNSMAPVTFTMRRYDKRGRVVSESRAETPRPHWIFERREFFSERALMAQKIRDPRVHPRLAIQDHESLIGAYLLLNSAKKVAAERIKSPEGAQRFLKLVRESLGNLIENGEKLPVAWVREQQQPYNGTSSERSAQEQQGLAR